MGYNIRFVWVPAHFVILGNDIADDLAKRRSLVSITSSENIFVSNLFSMLRRHISPLRDQKWSSLPPKYTIWRTNIVLITSRQSQFNVKNRSRVQIVNFTRLRLSHNSLRDHAQLLGLYCSPISTQHYEPHKYISSPNVILQVQIQWTKKRTFCET